MRGNRRRDTRPEVALRSALHRQGMRFRKDYPVRLPSGVMRLDVAFPRQRIAVLVDGCFWHQCPEHGTMPRANRDYWLAKLQRNAERDQRQTRELKQLGWHVLRFWEHEALKPAVERVRNALDTASSGNTDDGR